MFNVYLSDAQYLLPLAPMYNLTALVILLPSRHRMCIHGKCLWLNDRWYSKQSCHCIISNFHEHNHCHVIFSVDCPIWNQGWNHTLSYINIIVIAFEVVSSVRASLVHEVMLLIVTFVIENLEMLKQSQRFVHSVQGTGMTSSKLYSLSEESWLYWSKGV